MQALLYIDEISQAATLLNPLRVQLLKLMATPSTCTQMAESIGEVPQKVYYHVKKLHAAGLVDKVKERRVRAIMEAFYQARASSYWLSTKLVGIIGTQKQAQDQMSLAYIQSLAEQLHTDVGALSQHGEEEVNSLGLSATIELKDSAQRAAFAQDVQNMVKQLAAKYGRVDDDPNSSPENNTFNLMLACYPQPEPDTQPKGEHNG